MWPKLILAIIAVLLAFYLQVKGMRTDYQYRPPFIPLKLALFCTGFLSAFTLIWLVTSELLMTPDLLCFHILVSIAGGYSSSYAIPGQWQYLREKYRKNGASRNS